MIDPYWREQCTKRGVRLTHTHFFDCGHGHRDDQCCYCGLSKFEKAPAPELNIAIVNGPIEPKLALGRASGEDTGPGRGPLTEAQRKRLSLLSYLSAEGRLGGFGDKPRGSS